MPDLPRGELTPDLPRLRAFVEEVKGRHPPGNGYGCGACLTAWACDAARLATLAEGLLRVVEAATAMDETLQHHPDPIPVPVNVGLAVARVREMLAALAALEVGDG